METWTLATQSAFRDCLFCEVLFWDSLPAFMLDENLKCLNVIRHLIAFWNRVNLNKVQQGSLLTLLKASLMFPASSVVARLSELITEPKSSKPVLISTRKPLSCTNTHTHTLHQGLQQRSDKHWSSVSRSHLQDVFNDSLLVMVTSFQILHIKLE